MKKLNWKSIRILMILTVITLSITMLASCGSKSTVTTLTVNEANLTDAQTNGATLNFEYLKVLDNMLAQNADYRVWLIAAERGYNIIDGENASNDYSADLGCNVECAIAVLNKAKEETKVTISFDYSTINATDVKYLIDGLQETVDTEEAGGFMVAIGQALNWITNVLAGGKYVLGICIFAVLIELLMIYFAIRQQKNSIKQAKLAPKVQAIKNKYKGRNDQPTMQKMQQEIQDMYAKEGYNQLGGCLPLLIQLPIVMILYYIVVDPLHYVLKQTAAFSNALATFATTSKAAGGLGMASDVASRGNIAILSKIDENFINSLRNFRMFSNSADIADRVAGLKIPNFKLFGLEFGSIPNGAEWYLFFVPVFVFITYVVTMKLTRKFSPQPAQNQAIDPRQQACSNWMMDISMPALSAFFCLKVPAAVGVYWAFRSWIGLLKSYILAKAMPLPTYTEEDVKAAAKELAGKKTVVQKSERAGYVRSLHHIDDEDYDDTREAALERKRKMAELEAEKAEKEEKGIARAGLKDTNRHENLSEEAPENEIPKEQ